MALLLFSLVLAASLPQVHALADPRFIVPRRSVLSSAPILLALSGAEAAQDPSSRTSNTSSDNNKMSGEQINWGIIGLGDVTAAKSGPAFYKCTGSNLAAVMRRTPGAAQRWIDSCDAPNNSNIAAFDNLDEFLAYPNLDAVYIATPPGAHKDVALRVAQAELPCYIEKPVGRSGAETAAIVDAFQSHNVPLFTAYVSRAYERTQAIRKLLKDGAVGERVTCITYKLRGTGGARGMEQGKEYELPWRLNATKSGGGLIMDVGCHILDRIDYLCGPLVDVTGTAENRCSPNQAVEDYVDMSAKIGKSDWSTISCQGASVSCCWDFCNKEGKEAVDELIVTGPGGSLRMAAMSPSLPVEVLNAEGDIVRNLTFEAPQHAAQRLIQLVTDELRDIGSAPSRGDNALRTSNVLDTMLTGYYGGRDDAFWDREETWPCRKSKPLVA